MSTTKAKGEIIFICNAPGCTAKENSGCGAYFTALRLVKGRGWYAHRIRVGVVAEVWHHFCCYEHLKAVLDIDAPPAAA